MPEGEVCAVTGTTGYVGAALAGRLAAEGWSIRELTRSGRPSLGGTDAVRFTLGGEAATLANVNALVHCAWDFAARSWSEIAAVNVRGSIRLLDAAAAAGVERIVFISTMSAFPGARSMYGRAKLVVEEHAHALGAFVVRPGLVWSDEPGSLYGMLRSLALRLPLLPVPVGGTSRLHLVHEDDLGTLVAQLLTSPPREPGRPLLASGPEALPLTAILRTAAAAQRQPVRIVPIPWRLPWLALRGLELVGLQPAFRSDSLVSLVSLDPHPERSGVRDPGVEFRPFSPAVRPRSQTTRSDVRLP